MIGGFQVGAFQPAYQQVATATPAVVGGGGLGTRKRRAVVINGRPYIGTEDEIEALLWNILDEEEEVKPVKAKPKATVKPVEIEIDTEEIEIPEQINLPLYKFLVRESFQNNDPWLTFILRRIMEEYEDDEDLEIILMGVH